MEATTYEPGQAGSFTLRVSGLRPFTGPQEPPQVFIGTASADGLPVVPGTSITAWDGDRQRGSTTAGEGGRFTLLVSRSLGPITFKIGSLYADQTYPSWVSGDIVAGFDLTASDSCGVALTADGDTLGTWAAGCQSQVSGRGYARYYSFTLALESDVTIKLESTDADTYLYLREGQARSGAFLHQDDDSPDTTRSEIVATLAAGAYTIEATTYAAGETGSFILTVSGLSGADAGPDPGPGPGTDSCGKTVDADGVTNGTWAAGCQSSVAGRGYARYYTFTLTETGGVAIDLESSVDTYLFLREGEARSGGFLHENDDVESGRNLNSRINETLVPGTYTIEATTYRTGETGTFSLTISGLGVG